MKSLNFTGIQTYKERKNTITSSAYLGIDNIKFYSMSTETEESNSQQKDSLLISPRGVS